MVIFNEDRELFKETAIGEWLDCLFEDTETGEEFFVELRKADETIEKFIARCEEVAEENFDEVEYIELMSIEAAEALGYDIF